MLCDNNTIKLPLTTSTCPRIRPIYRVPASTASIASPHPPHPSPPASATSIASRVRRIHRVRHVHHLSFDPRQGLLPSVAPFPPTHGATSRYFVDSSVTTGGRRGRAASGALTQLSGPCGGRFARTCIYGQSCQPSLRIVSEKKSSSTPHVPPRRYCGA